MKKVIALTIGLLILATASMAQTKEQEKANQRYTQLHKKYAQNTRDVMILVELADFYADTTNPMYNLPMAIKYIDSAKHNYIQIIEDNERYDEARKAIKHGITIPLIKEKKQNITVAARNYVANSTTITELELDNFAIAFADDKQVIRSIERQRINSKWREAQRINTFESYLEFQEKYPNTAESELAASSIEQLAKNMFKKCETDEEVDLMMAQYRTLPAVQQAATQHKAYLAFRQAEKKNTISAYRKYMKDYPSGDNYATAMNRVGSLMISQFSTLNTADDLVDFVLINSDNPMADQAMERLRNMILVEQDMHAMSLYLKNFPLDPSRNDIYRQYYDWCAFEGDIQPLKDFAEANPDFPFELALRRDLRNAEQNNDVPLTGDFNTSDFDQYASYIRRVTGKGLAFVALQRVLQPYIAKQDWSGAISRMDYFTLSFESNDAERYQALRNMIKAPNNNNRALSTEVTPNYNMTHPIINKDGSKLYYTKLSGSTTQIGVADRVRGKGYKWITEDPIKFDNDNNTRLLLFCLYANENKMLVGKEGNIHVAVRNGEKWHLEEALPAPINTEYIETDAYMLPDGSGILLASDRPNGHNFNKSGTLFHGDYALATDIYFIPYTKDGWGDPINLGLNVNSAYCDRSPVLSKDLKTLYFISDGRAGFGYGDVWKTYRNDITDWTHWQTPENLGKEVNTGYRESSVSISGDDRRLIISSNRHNGTYGCYSLPSQHEKGADMIETKIDGRSFGEDLLYLGIVDMLTHTLVHTIDVEMPEVEVSLYEDREYALVAEVKDKYAPAMLFNPKQSEVIRPNEPYTPGMLTALQKEIPMIAITFAEGSKNPDEYSTSELQRLARFLKEHPDIRVELSVNVAGEDDMKCYNTSLERGRKIKRIMTNTGATTDQVSVSAFGNVNYKDNPKTTPIVARFSRF